MKPMDTSDFSMTNGAMYFAEQKDFERYRQAVKQPKKEVSWNHFFVRPHMFTWRPGYNMQ